MRFWQKIFLFSLALLMVTISIVSLLLLRGNHQGNIEQARQNGISTHDLVIGSMQTAVVHDRYQTGEGFLTEDEMIKSLLRLAESYNQPVFFSGLQDLRSPAVFFQIYSGQDQLVSSLPFEPVLNQTQDKGRLSAFFSNYSAQDQVMSRPELEPVDPLDRYTIIRELEQGHWLFVSSQIELENRTYTLVTIQDISSIYDLLYKQIRLFADLMLVLALAAAGVLLIIVVWLTRPIAILRQYTSRFSQGEYNIRLSVGGRDELSALGHDFNNMADAVEKNINSLQQMNEERTRFIDNLTHEIKSPLTSIIGFADLLRQAPSISDEERRRQADFIYREGRQLEHIAKLLMELTLMGRSQFDLETVDLHDLLEEIWLLIRPTMEKYQVRLILDNQHGYVRVSLELFRSLITNLLENAAKASNPEQTVLLQAIKQDDNSMIMLVKDEGCGIPEAELDKIKQPFYVLDKARTRKAGGAGLGLALCDEIVKLHDADMIIDSKLGEGTTISIHFPPVPAVEEIKAVEEIMLNDELQDDEGEQENA